jgi:hypothetical protein
MRQYRYVMAASDGTSYDYARRDNFFSQCFDLPELLADGWKPLREVPMGQGTWVVDGEATTYGLVMILLEKRMPRKGSAAAK